MFRSLQNTARIEVTLKPDGPLLVRAQSVGITPGIADMEFQRTYRDGESTVFLAGSGLKGVVRSHCERLLRSVGRFACDPTRTRDPATCGVGKRDEPRDPEHYPHAGNCAACFTFGSLKLAGRFRIADAYPLRDLAGASNRTEVRTGVGIDRKSMAARESVLYDSEVVVGGGFRLCASGENFSLWQLGLLLAALQDLDAGLVRIGGCKARGMGSVKLAGWSVELGFLGSGKGMLAGARLLPGDEDDYRLPQEDSLPAPSGFEETTKGLFRTLSYQAENVATLADALIEGPLARYLQGAC